MSKNILIACEDFRVGGAQVFALRLANVLAKEHKVYLYSHYANYIDYKLAKGIAPDVTILSANIQFEWLIRKFDRLLYKLGIDYISREKFVINHIRKVVQNYKINLVHSHMFKSDYVVAKALQKINVPLVITMHGNYEGFLQSYLDKKGGEVILNYPKKLKEVLARINGLAYLTDKNLRIFQETVLVPKNCYQHIIKKKIYNGFSGSVDAQYRRSELGIADDALVFGMVARGIPEKGWETAIEAFNLLSQSKIHLVLVGWSDYVADLAKKYQDQRNIHFVGYTSNPLNWIQIFDVGLLPSVYGESLPNVIVEYLYCGKPAIVSDVGESSNMIKWNNRHVGFVAQVINVVINVNEFASHMQKYVDNQELLKYHQSLAKNAFDKFNMQYCLQNYKALYERVNGEKATTDIGDYASIQL